MDRSLFRLAVRLATADHDRQQLAHDFLVAVAGLRPGEDADVVDTIADGVAGLESLDAGSREAMENLATEGDAVAVAVAVAGAESATRRILVRQLGGLGVMSSESPEEIARAILGLDEDRRSLVREVAQSLGRPASTTPKPRSRKSRSRKAPAPDASPKPAREDEDSATLGALVAGTVEPLPPLDAPPPTEAALVSLDPPVASSFLPRESS